MPSERKDQVVERSAKVIDHLAHPDLQQFRDENISASKKVVTGLIDSFEVLIGANFIRIIEREGVKLGVDIRQVFPCPLVPEPRPFKAIADRHGATSSP
jgi:hypothetical protein